MLQGITFLQVAVLDPCKFCDSQKISVPAVMLEAVGIYKARYITLENRLVSVCTIDLTVSNS